VSNRTIQLDDRTYEYLLAHSLREAPALAKLRAETASHPKVNMQIAPEQGQFMQMLVRLTGARRAIEVGVFTGYSSLAVMLAMPKDGRLLALDVSEEFTAIARRHWQAAGVADRIELVIAPAKDTLDARIAAGESGRYDFAFIDADKGGYLAYYERLIKLVRPGGLIAVRTRRTAILTRWRSGNSTTYFTRTRASSSRCCRLATASPSQGFREAG
jgi:predicted O-methyltransferase YrrM